MADINKNIKIPLGNSKLSMEFALIPAGEFWMGSPEGAGCKNEYPRHRVYTDAFYMGIYPVTEKQWEAVMGKESDVCTRREDFYSMMLEEYGPDMIAAGHKRSADGTFNKNEPINLLSWEDCQEFMEKLSSLSGKALRLPTEAEWEKAARGGTDTQYHWSDDCDEGEYAWYACNSRCCIHPVGLKKPNQYGLYDMAGNIRQWCADWYGENYYKKSPKNNPQGPKSGVARVIKGSCWDDGSSRGGGLSPSRRDCLDPETYGDMTVGFRCAYPAQ